MAAKKKKLGQMLLEARQLTEAQLQKALADQGSTGLLLGQQLVTNGTVDETVLTDILSEQLAVTRYVSTEHNPSADAHSFFPQDMAVSLSAAPLERTGSVLLVATPYPMDIKAIEAIEMHTDSSVEPLICSETELAALMTNIYGPGHGLRTGWEQNIFGSNAAEGDPLDLVLDSGAEDDPITRRSLDLIAPAKTNHADAVYIMQAPAGPEIRLRYGASLVMLDEPPRDLFPVMAGRIAALAGIDMSKSVSGSFRTPISGVAHAVFVQSMPSIYGAQLCCRVRPLSPSRKLNTVGLHPNDLKHLTSMLFHPGGLYLFSGSPGSGIHDTLHAVLRHTAVSDILTLTLESTVEDRLDNVHHCLSGPNISNSVEAALSMQPDQIMLSMDHARHNLSAAIRCTAEDVRTFASISAGSLASALFQLIASTAHPSLAANRLQVVAHQHPVSANCPECATSYTPSEEVIERLGLQKAGKVEFKRGAGCKGCSGTGFAAPTALFETLWFNDSLRATLSTGDVAKTIAEAISARRIRRMRNEAARKAAQGIITAETALAVTGL